MAARLPVLVRQTKTFELVIEGKSAAAIAKRLGVSEDTVARDMQDIAEQVQALVKERHGEILAIALANYQWVMDQAKAEFEADRRYEKQWRKGEHDYEVEITKDTNLGVMTETKMVRPRFQSQRPQWLNLVITATREITALSGIKKLTIEHGGTVRVEHQLSDDERATSVMALLDRGRARRAGLVLDAESGDVS